MKDFKKLKVLEVDWQTLVAYEDEVMNDADIDEPQSQGSSPRSDAARFIPDVVAALPPTILHLKVLRFSEADLASIVRLLKEKEQGRAASDLKNITLCRASRRSSAPSSWEQLDDVAEKAGVVVDDYVHITQASIMKP